MSNGEILAELHRLRQENDRLRKDLATALAEIETLRAEADFLRSMSAA